jgi:hypothetical protein
MTQLLCPLYRSKPKTLRTLEGFLAVYGLEKIGLDETDISWVAESEEEKQRLRIPSFTFRFKKPDSVSLKLPFGVITQAIMGATETLDWEVPLNFFRKGKNDFLERRFIDAIHDFYFLLETLFANGKTKNKHVMAEFTKSSTLIALSAQVLKEGEMSVYRRSKKNLLEIFRNKYSKKSPEEYLKDIVKLRGFLHHHTIQNSKIWNPSLEYEYEMDAILIQELCFKVCISKVEPLIYTPRRPPSSS